MRILLTAAVAAAIMPSVHVVVADDRHVSYLDGTHLFPGAHYSVQIDAATHSSNASNNHQSYDGKIYGKASVFPAFIRKMQQVTGRIVNLPEGYSFHDVQVQTLYLTESSVRHIDSRVEGRTPLEDSEDSLTAFYVQESTADAYFETDDGELCIPYVEGSAIYFNGGLPHQSIVKSGAVKLVGPFLLSTLESVGAPVFPSPSTGPSLSPSTGPSVSPSTGPSFSPSTGPSVSPSTGPSVSPSTGPSVSPSTGPSVSPSTGPSLSLSPPNPPTPVPTYPPTPTPVPSPHPTPNPTQKPSKHPTKEPTWMPSEKPVWKAPAWNGWSKPTERPVDAWNGWSKPTKRPVNAWNGWSKPAWNSWGGGWGPKPTKKPTQPPVNAWDSSWSGKSPTDWVLNGWGGDAWTNNNAWAGDGH